MNLISLAIETATSGAEYLNTGAEKAFGAVLLLFGIAIVVVIFRKVLKRKVDKTITKVKDRLK
jgi:biopolymer transport protein ExbB/TolQ